MALIHLLEKETGSVMSCWYEKVATIDTGLEQEYQVQVPMNTGALPFCDANRLTHMKPLYRDSMAQDTHSKVRWVNHNCSKAALLRITSFMAGVYILQASLACVVGVLSIEEESNDYIALDRAIGA